MRKYLAVIASVLILSGCVHHSPFLSEYYFQAMGDDGELVMTMDASSLKESSLCIPSNEILDRSDRISIAMSPDDSTVYPLPISDWTLYGAAEGNFGTILVPTAISYIDGFEKVGKGSGKYYTNGFVSVGVPENGILLFSTGDYLEAKDKTLDNRSLLIPSELASDMAENLFSIYVSEPKTMMDLGFELPYAVLSGMNYALITVDETNEGFFLSSVVDFKDERDAKTFTTLMRNMIVQEIRRDGGKLDFKALSDMIVCERNRSYINDREMTREEVDLYLERALSLSGGLI